MRVPGTRLNMFTVDNFVIIFPKVLEHEMFQILCCISDYQFLAKAWRNLVRGIDSYLLVEVL